MKTAQSGYVQRKMVKIMEDVQVKYDQTVRNSVNSIIQFAYGQDNMDGSKTVVLQENEHICDIDRLADRLNLQFEINQ
jgi:DNA-directed RNA polymerase beta' subunit